MVREERSERLERCVCVVSSPFARDGPLSCRVRCQVNEWVALSDVAVSVLRGVSEQRVRSLEAGEAASSAK
jgi:hypothetical protein